MVFSIFGWKRTPSKKAESKPLAGKAPDAKPKSPSADPASPASHAETAEATGGDSLDFSTYVPPPKSELRAEAVPVVPPTPPAASAQREASMEMPAAAPVTPSLPTALRVYPSSMGAGTGISAPAEGVSPIIEETATLFAKGQDEQALSALSRSVREGDLGNSTLRAWLMLFDLHQHLGMKVEFEALALEFVVKFERSPPAWIETGERKDPALATGGIAYFALGTMLSDASAPQLEELRNAGTRQTLRVECGKLEGVDGAGCRLFHETLLSLRDAGREVLLTGEARLIQLLEDACQRGRVETDGSVWTLLFDVYRILDAKDKFEEAAVNYAVTFEVSPPSWESQPGAEAGGSAVLRPVEAADQALVLSGELSGTSETLAQQLQDWAVANKMLVIDMSRATRVDLVTAGLMLNVLSKLQEAGTTIQIRGANELICALFEVTGLSKVARIIPRK